MLFLTNPRRKRRAAPRVRRKRRSRFKKGSAAAKRYMASIRPKKRRRVAVARKRRRRAVRLNTGGSMARRKRRVSVRRRRRSSRARTVYRANPRRRSRRRSYRRNPSMRGIVGTAKQAVVDAVGITVGQIAVRAIPKYIPGATQPGALGLAIQAAVAIAAGWAGHRFAGANMGRMIAAGGVNAVLVTAIKAANVPVVSAALAGDDDVAMLSGYPSLAGYPEVSGGSASGGLSPVGMSGIDDASMDDMNLALNY